MNANTHGYIWREKDLNRMIHQYGNKPSRETKNKLSEHLEAQRATFKAVELNRAREKGQSRGLGR